MSRGKRYNDEGKLNYTKVLAVLIAIIVIIMFVIMIKKVTSEKNSTNESYNATNYFAIYSDNKWGIIDSTGNTVIDPMYQEMLIVVDKTRDVFLCTYDINEETGEYKTKVINKKNEEIFTDYDKVEPLENYDSDGNAWYEQNVLRVEKNGKYGLIDLDGKKITEIKYDEIETLKGVQNSILVKENGKYGLINTSGATIVNPKFSEIKAYDTDDYKHGYITIDENKKYGLVSYAGTTILKNEYEKIEQIYGEKYFVIDEGKSQKVIDSIGNVVLEKDFDSISQINSDGVVFQKDKKYGFMNYEGKVLIDAKYDELKELNIGILRAKKDKNYGIIDLEDKEKLKFKYSDIYYKENAGFYVAEGDSYNSEILDSDFNVKAEGIISELNEDKGYIKLKVGDEYKYYNFKFEGKNVTEVLSSNTLFVSQKDGKYGFVDKDGNVVVDYIYDEAQEQNSYGFAAVKKDNLWGSIDSKGKEVITPKYKLENYLVIDFIGKWHLGQDLNMNYYCEK